MVLSLVAALALTAEPVRLAPGTQEVIKVPGVSKIALGDPNVADITPVKAGELLVLGKQRGKTTLTLWTPAGIQTRQIVVDDGKTSEIGKMVKDLVSPSLRVEQFSGHTVIDGTLDSVQELQRLRALVGDDPNVKLLVRLNPRVLPVVAEQITAELKKQGLGSAKAVCVGQTIFLEGSVADERELKKAMLIADAHYGLATSSLALR